MDCSLGCDLICDSSQIPKVCDSRLQAEVGLAFVLSTGDQRLADLNREDAITINAGHVLSVLTSLGGSIVCLFETDLVVFPKRLWQERE